MCLQSSMAASTNKTMWKQPLRGASLKQLFLKFNILNSGNLSIGDLVIFLRHSCEGVPFSKITACNSTKRLNLFAVISSRIVQYFKKIYFKKKL